MILKNRLPSAYQEVEYIESSGTQYIDSGVIGKYGLSTYAKLVNKGNVSDNAVLLGCRVDTGQTRIYLGYRTFNNYVNIGYQEEFQSNTTPIINALHTYEYSINNGYASIKQDGITILNQAIVDLDYNTNLAMYVFRNNYTAPSALSCQLYLLKIYDNSVLVRNFIPCYRKSDNEIGLYDLVNNQFYTNQGTGTFLKGNDVLTKYTSVYHGTTRMTKIYKGSQCVFNDLPKGFVRCEYLESSGTEYIDTGINADNNLNVLFTFQYVGAFVNTQEMGAIKRLTSSTYSRHHLEAYNSELYYGKKTGSGSLVDLGTFDNDKHTIETTNTSIIYDNISHSINDDVFDCEINYWLFGRSANGLSITYSIIRIFEAKLFYNSVLVRNFIPCLDTTGTPCLYDTITKTCFYNQGTGEFKYKVKVPSGYQAVEYIESSGTQYVDTGFTANQDTKAVLEVMTNNVSCGLFGSRSGFQNSSFGILIGSSTYNVSFSNFTTGTITPDTNKHHFEISKNGIIVDNNSYSISSYANFITPTNLFIFNFGNSLYSVLAQAKLYSCQIYDNTTLIRYFQPVYRLTDNEIGLYDLVNRKFYTNAGTGTFGKGSDV